MLYSSLILLPLMSFAAVAHDLNDSVQAFVRWAVPQGGIIFQGAVETNEVVYDLFVLHQDQRRGVMVVASTSGNLSEPSPQVVFADTSLEAAMNGAIPADVSAQLRALLGNNQPSSNESQSEAPPRDIYPLGAALNLVLVPITGFAFKSNSTLSILKELQRSDAIPINPSTAPIGSILVCPTTYSPTGPVALGSVTILGSDGNVHGPDARNGCAWTSFGNLGAWIDQQTNRTQLFAFLLRAHPDRK